jgi:hypothetical protein
LTIPSLIWGKEMFHHIQRNHSRQRLSFMSHEPPCLACHSSCWSNNRLCIAILILKTRLSSYFIESRSRNYTLRKARATRQILKFHKENRSRSLNS